MASIILFGRTLAETSKKANDDTIVLWAATMAGALTRLRRRFSFDDGVNTAPFTHETLKSTIIYCKLLKQQIYLLYLPMNATRKTKIKKKRLEMARFYTITSIR